MISSRLKAVMPRSLYGRATLILLVPILTILTVVSVVFIQRLYEGVTGQMTRAAVAEVKLVIDILERAPDLERGLEAARAVAGPLDIVIGPVEAPISDRREWIDFSGITVAAVLAESLPTVRAIDLAAAGGLVALAAETRHGPVRVALPRGRLSPRNPHQLLVLMAFTAFFMTIIALLYLRGQVQPIRRLAAAAEAFGKGRVVPYRPSGATEVRAAGGAFLEMRNRIERQIEQRTLLLSGVSHDLRTPLTRMKLSLGMMEDEDEAAAMRADVEDMERMVDAFLDFARTEALGDPERVAPDELAREAIARARRAALAVEEGRIDPGPKSPMRPMALDRALDNLIGNAVRYGGSARLSVLRGKREIAFVVEDRGPGIPEDRRAEALRPFTRLDRSRNQNAGSGAGLGLSIAADIARRHGGRLELDRSAELGGLSARLVIPA